MDNNCLQLESAILGLQALRIRVTKMLVETVSLPTEALMVPCCLCTAAHAGPADQGPASFTLWPYLWGPVQEPTSEGIQKIDEHGFQRATTHNTVFDIIGILTVRQAWE